VFQRYGNIEQIIRSYPRLPQDVCDVCCAPRDLLNCHRGFITNKDELIPSKLLVVGYYQKQGIDRLTEDVWKTRSSSNDFYNLSARIMEALAKLTLVETSESYSHIFLIPSRSGKKTLLAKITEKISNEFNLELLRADDWLYYNKELHNQVHIREVTDFKKRMKLVLELYKPKNDIPYSIGNSRIILIDDIIQSGLTMNRIGSILKYYGANDIHGFSWLRAIKDMNIFG